MNIDLRHLSNDREMEINEEVIIPPEYYEKLSIIRMTPIKVTGILRINSAEEIEVVLNLVGTMELPCAITLEPVPHHFSIDIDEVIPASDAISVALLDVLWENIVLEVPMRVIKPGIKKSNMQGDGWEFET